MEQNVLNKTNKFTMPQMDKELFIEYIYGIFIALLHFYTSYFVNTQFIKLSLRNFIINYF